jgi:type II secretory pathway pseudopilin PulG
MKTKNHNAGFTLSEVLVAAALSTLVMAMFLTLLLKSLGLWRDGMARLQLSEHSRITRERVLHGINGQFGLRHAGRTQVIYSTNQITFSEVSSTATNIFTLLLDANQPAAYSDAAGQRRLIQGRTFVDQVSITNNGNILNIDLTLAMTNGWKKYTQPQQIRVYMLNE